MSHPLIDGARELELARDLQESRKALEKLANGLPASCKSRIFRGDLHPPRDGHGWSTREIERFCDRLSRQERAEGNPGISELMRAARNYKRRIDTAREALILANLRLVVFIAKRHVNCGVSLLDVIQEGNIGLMKAVEKFDHRLGNKFSTYAYWWIKQSIDRAITVRWRTIRVPVHLVTTWRRIARAARALDQRFGRQAAPKEIADLLQMSCDEVEDVIGCVRDSREDRQTEGESPDPLETVENERPTSPLHEVQAREAREKVEEVLKSLRPREEQIIRLRFGIGRDDARTLQEIGAIMNLSRERVRQIESVALKKLRTSEALRACQG